METTGRPDGERLALQFDMAGCPNRCRHCWLGSHKNGRMSADEVREMTAEFRAAEGRAREYAVFSWWREPDYRDDYRELWELEKELSDEGLAERFELLSGWRLARDESYAPWAASIGTRVCQLTFAGLEENTDWFMRRSGAFRDQLTATERLIEAGIAPRWQLFLTKRNLHELEAFLDLMEELRLYERCRRRGMEFTFFMWSMAPEGNAYDIEDIRLEEGDLERIPGALAALSSSDISRVLAPEYKLLEGLRNNNAAPNIEPPVRAIAIDAEYNAYPNNAEPAEHWRLGNLKRDGAGAILREYREESTPAMRANRTVTVSELARRFGDTSSRKLYDSDDLICRFMHQLGAEQR